MSGGDLTAPLSFTSTPDYQSLLEYREPELNDATTRGYPILANTNYKHSVQVSGLSAGTTYDYTVTQGEETFSATFSTAPGDDWQHIRFMALSDSETEPRGAIQTRDWPAGPQAEGSLGRPETWPTDSSNRDLYLLNQTDGYAQNLRIIDERDPDLVVMPGDLVQGGGYQFGWDEFFRHNAGEFDDVLTKRPIVPALGNWENFAAINGGYGIAADFNAVAFSRSKYKVYFDTPSNGTPSHQDNYHRVDYGPLCILTLDSSNGEPDVAPSDRNNPETPDTDTQINYTAENFRANNDNDFTDGTDVSDFNPGSTQYEWVVEQLEDCRANNKIVFVQYHNVAYSSGVHGIPNAGLPGSTVTPSGQAGTPLRQYMPLFDQYGVVAVLSGHSEIAERSYVDDGIDPIGINYYDVGIGGDGMRGVRTDTDLSVQNPFSQWTADQDAPELWEEVTDKQGNTYTILTQGGKHYGHLEVNLYKCGETPVMTLQVAYSFPKLDSNLELIGATDRRVYDDVQLITFNADGTPASQTKVTLVNGTDSRDSLMGTSGPDFISGLKGRDMLTGGEGMDTFVYNELTEAGDTITDFTVGEDIIDLTSLLGGLGVTSKDPIADGFVTFRARGADAFVLVDVDGDGPGRGRTLIRVRNVSVTDLNSSCNFLF